MERTAEIYRMRDVLAYTYTSRLGAPTIIMGKNGIPVFVFTPNEPYLISPCFTL
jgi:hypothetical protein